MPGAVDKADYVDDDDIEMIYRRFTRKEFVEICKRINATLYDPKMADLIEAIDQSDMNRINETFPNAKLFYETIESHKSHMQMTRRHQFKLDVKKKRHNELRKMHLESPEEDLVLDEESFQDFVLDKGKIDLFDDEVYDNLKKRVEDPFGPFFLESIRTLMQGDLSEETKRRVREWTSSTGRPNVDDNDDNVNPQGE